MYRCDLCTTVVPPRTPAHRVVLETRLRHYPSRPRTFPPLDRRERNKLEKWKDDPGGAGHETVREALACPACARACRAGSG
jgi:hypothetical protein